MSPMNSYPEGSAVLPTPKGWTARTELASGVTLPPLAKSTSPRHPAIAEDQRGIPRPIRRERRVRLSI
jgi:hypothetical protein